MASTSTKLKAEFNCDECARRHKKCDRLLPKCSYCQSKNKECTKKRRLVNRKRLFILEDKLFKYKLDQTEDVKAKEEKQSLKFILQSPEDYKKINPFKN